jgi:hypothetical protein
LPAPTDRVARPGLTICSVAFKARQCLDLNRRLVEALNPDSPVEWLLFDNNDDPAERLADDDQRFTVVRPGRRDTDMGYEHAVGLVSLFPHIHTRFVLFCDPDCFIVRPGWIDAVLTHMQDEGLAFFGTPINPRRHNSYRYFPYCVCMFVDLERVPLQELNLIPNVWRLPDALGYRVRRALAGVPRAGALFRWLLTEKWPTNGWRIRAKYGDHPAVRHECVQPVWDTDAAVPPGLRRLLHALTPGSVSPVPKRPGYCSPVGFRDMGEVDLEGIGWEEFVWHGAPFAFHVGSVHSSARQPYAPTLTEVCEAFIRAADGTHPAAAVPGGSRPHEVGSP